jgi:hypothetical protein
MANSKISALPSATTPLAGTEVLPVVQSGITEQVAVNNLTVRNVRANATTGILQITGPTAGTTRIATVPDANFTIARTDAAQSFTGDQTLSTGNLVIGTSGQGIDFSATPSTGTSELFDDYEEGTWTPGYAPTAGSFTTITYGFANGYYRKIGDTVFCTCRLRTSAFVVGTGSGNVLLTGLPFTTFSATASNAATPAAISVNWVVNPSGIITVASSTTAQIQKTFSNTSTVVADMNVGLANNFLTLTFFYVAA